MLKELGIYNEKNEYLPVVPTYIVGANEEIRAYLRGVFFASGSINDPKTSRYHLEILVTEPEEAVFVQKLLNIFDLNAKILNREKGYMIYIKEAEKISDFIKILGANNAVMYYENVRIYRDQKNKTNRLNNMEQANIDRVFETANEQLRQIKIIEDNNGMDLLDDRTKLAVRYRKEYPETSLKELAEIITLETGKSLSKSGINHRFRKVRELAASFEKMNKKIRKVESLTAVHTSNHSEKGITLIALVVTIVVLLILAGVSINLVIGDNGIITRAKEAASQTEVASAKDDMELYLTGLRLTKEQDASFRLADYLSSNIGNEGIEDFLNNGDGTAQVAYKGNKYSVNLEDYTFEYLGKTDGMGVNRHIKQVLDNNNEDVPGIAMVEAGELETEDLGWKVLSINDDGTVNLIANNNTGFEVSLSGINGYTNGAKALNEICSKLYSGLEINGKKVLSARSANLTDFYDVTYQLNRKYEQGKKIQPVINTKDVENDGYSTEQILSLIHI